MFLMRFETSSSLCWMIGSSFGSFSRVGRVDRPTVPLLPTVEGALGGMVDWIVPLDGTWFGLAVGGGGPSAGATLVFPGLVVPGPVPGCVGVPPPPRLLLAAPALAPPAVPGPVWAVAKVAEETRRAAAIATFVMDFMGGPHCKFVLPDNRRGEPMVPSWAGCAVRRRRRDRVARSGLRRAAHQRVGRGERHRRQSVLADRKLAEL